MVKAVGSMARPASTIDAIRKPARRAQFSRDRRFLPWFDPYGRGQVPSSPTSNDHARGLPSLGRDQDNERGSSGHRTSSISRLHRLLEISRPTRRAATREGPLIESFGHIAVIPVAAGEEDPWETKGSDGQSSQHK